MTYDGVEESRFADIREANNAGFETHANFGGQGREPPPDSHISHEVRLLPEEERMIYGR